MTTKKIKKTKLLIAKKPLKVPATMIGKSNWFPEKDYLFTGFV
jgi:hypothetical protein